MWRDLSSSEKRKAVRLLIAVPAIPISYLCLIALPLAGMFLVGAKSGQAMSSGAAELSLPLAGLVPLFVGAACAAAGLVVSPGWKLRAAALPAALCYLGALWFAFGR